MAKVFINPSVSCLRIQDFFSNLPEIFMISPLSCQRIYKPFFRCLRGVTASSFTCQGESDFLPWNVSEIQGSSMSLNSKETPETSPQDYPAALNRLNLFNKTASTTTSLTKTVCVATNQDKFRFVLTTAWVMHSAWGPPRLWPCSQLLLVSVA